MPAIILMAGENAAVAHSPAPEKPPTAATFYLFRRDSGQTEDLLNSLRTPKYGRHNLRFHSAFPEPEMSNATAMYRALEELTRRFEILHRKFGELFEAARYLEDRKNFGPSIKLGNHLDKNYFTVAFLDKSLIFRFSSALSETNSPVGIVTCLEPNPDDESEPQGVLSISFSTSGKVSGIDKPDDIEDPLDIGDTATAIFIVSHCVYLVLRKGMQA